MNAQPDDLSWRRPPRRWSMPECTTVAFKWPQRTIDKDDKETSLALVVGDKHPTTAIYLVLSLSKTLLGWGGVVDFTLISTMEIHKSGNQSSDGWQGQPWSWLKSSSDKVIETWVDRKEVSLSLWMTIQTWIDRDKDVLGGSNGQRCQREEVKLANPFRFPARTKPGDLTNSKWFWTHILDLETRFQSWKGDLADDEWVLGHPLIFCETSFTTRIAINANGMMADKIKGPKRSSLKWMPDTTDRTNSDVLLTNLLESFPLYSNLHLIY